MRQPAIRHRPLLTFAFLFFLASQNLAQQELGLHFLRGVWQSNSTNPAFVQEQWLTIGLPGIYSAFTFNGPTYNQIFTEENGITVVDADELIARLKAESDGRHDLGIPTLSVSRRLRDLTISFGHAVKYSAFLRVPKTLPQLVWQGNAQFIGQEVQLGNELHLAGYQELTGGVAYDFGSISLGANLKYLSGIGGAATDERRHSASLYTDPDVYQITVDADYLLHSAGTFDYEQFKDLNLDFDYASLTLDKLFGKNNGLALDLGLRAELGKFDLAASVTDLGKLTWDTGVTDYAANRTIRYDGLDFSGALTGDSVTFEGALDTLKAIFRVEETPGASYTTTLARKLYVSARFQLSERWWLGALFFNEAYRDQPVSTLAIGANFQPVKYLNAGLTCAAGNRIGLVRVGANLTLTLGPVQVFGTTDNLLSLVAPRSSKHFSARLGGSLFFR